MSERESNLDKKLMWGGGAAALIGAGLGVGLIVELGLLAAGAGGATRYAKNKFGKK